VAAVPLREAMTDVIVVLVLAVSSLVRFIEVGLVMIVVVLPLFSVHVLVCIMVATVVACSIV